MDKTIPSPRDRSTSSARRKSAWNWFLAITPANNKTNSAMNIANPEKMNKPVLPKPANRISSSFRSSSESTTSSAVGAYADHNSEPGCVTERPRSDGGFCEVHMEKVNTSSSASPRPVSARRLSNLFKGVSGRLRGSKTSRQSFASSVPMSVESSTNDDTNWSSSPQLPRGESKSLVRYYSMERDEIPHREMSGGSLDGTRESRTASEVSLSFFSTSQSSSSPVPSPRTPRIRRADSNRSTSSTGSRPVSVRTMLNGLSGVRSAQAVLRTTRRESIKSQQPMTEDVHQNILLKVQFVSLVNDLQKMDGDEEEPAKTKAMKAERISRMFLQEDSIFFLKDIPEHYYAVALDPMDEEYLLNVLLNLKTSLVEELAQHDSIDAILKECSKW